jgi:hypothetical protein
MVAPLFVGAGVAYGAHAWLPVVVSRPGAGIDATPHYLLNGGRSVPRWLRGVGDPDLARVPSSAIGSRFAS